MMRRLAIRLGRWRLHQYLEANKEIGLPCVYSFRAICICHHLARRKRSPRSLEFGPRLYGPGYFG